MGKHDGAAVQRLAALYGLKCTAQGAGKRLTIMVRFRWLPHDRAAHAESGVDTSIPHRVMSLLSAINTTLISDVCTSLAAAHRWRPRDLL